MESSLDVVVLEPFCAGSHAAWLDGWVRHTSHRIRALTLEGRWWKWRMHGGAVTLADRWNALAAGGRPAPDVFVATDMLDVTTFQALTRESTAGVPFVLYMHENQLTYPWSPIDRDRARGTDAHYGFINVASALACDAVWFNSAYHRDAFLPAAGEFLARFPDCRLDDATARIERRSRVMHVGVDLASLDDVEPARAPGSGVPRVVWNHRWEYDKDPDAFFDALVALRERGVDFELVVLGERFDTVPDAFDRARERLGERIVHWGTAPDRRSYAAWLRSADVLPVTSRHDFFGISVVEAVHCGVAPLLPRRLAYPELLDPDAFPEHFYDRPDEFVATLEAWLRDPAHIPGPGALRRAVARFDWRRRAPAYDEALRGLVRRRTSRPTLDAAAPGE